MRVIWSERAAFAVKDTALYIEKEFDQKAKKEFLNKIDKFDILLHTNPYMGKEEPLLKKLPEKYRSFVIDHINKAVYRVLPDGNIIIVTLWDCRRAPETLVSQI